MKRFTGLVLAAPLLLSGCAALQIDVDVYKGPLVHDEDTQVQQLASIALSGKAVMLVQRNKWLDTVEKGWRQEAQKLSQKDPAESPLTRHIRADEWQSLALHDCSAGAATCRNARLINDMLSAYDDRATPGLQRELDQAQQHYKEYTAARNDYLRAGEEAEAQKLVEDRAREHRNGPLEAKALAAKLAARQAEAQALVTAIERLRQRWGSLVSLLQATKLRVAAQAPGSPQLAERQVAEILAKLTDPKRLLCADETLRLGGELGRGLALARRAIEAVAPGAAVEIQLVADQRAAAQLNAALRMAPASEMPELLRAMNQPTSADDCVLTGSRMKSTPQRMVLNTVRLGVQRDVEGAKGEALDRDLEDADDALWRELQQTQASGFDSGRPQPGLDRLANEAADFRLKRRNSEGRKGESRTDGTAELADNTTTKQLQDSVVDLASRMQFLAVNLSLVDDGAAAAAPTGNSLALYGLASPSESKKASEAQTSARAFKATLETIANSLLVLAEDQRRQRSHRVQQRGMAAGEYQSAVAAFQIDPAKRFDQLLQFLRDRQKTALHQEDGLKREREAAIKAATVAAVAAEGPVREQTKKLQAALMLALTLEGKLPPGLPEEAKAPETEEAQEWAKDSERLLAELQRAPARIGLVDLRLRVQKWLQKAADEGDINLPRHRRLMTALDQLRLIQTGNEPMPRAEALAHTRRDINQRAVEGARPLAALNATFKQKTDLLKTAQEPLKADPAPRSALLLAALEAVQNNRAAVLATAAAGKGLHDAEILAGTLKTQLQSLAADKAAVKALALEQVDLWAAGVKAPIVLPPALAHSALATLDRVEAYLSYSRVEALQRGSAGGAQQASDALEALMARRERMAYLRPASTYLRSALATTGQQSDPGLEWQNLLWAKIMRLIPDRRPEIERERAVRADLDKSFWQNVNKVSVSAGGNSNFAIAKDDVGNWYVKAMGADADAMVKAAKGLALFNLGGRVDSNFLRMDELRGIKNRSASEETELLDLQQGRNGAAANAYGSTLKVFAANHSQAVVGLLTELDTQLKANALGQQLGQHWDTRYDPGANEAKRSKMPNLDMSTAGDLSSLHSQALSATGNGLLATAESPAGSTASDLLIKALSLLVQQRNRLRGMVAETADLLTPELAEAKAAKGRLVSATTALAEAQEARIKPAAELKALEDQVAGLGSSATQEERTRLASALAAKHTAVNQASNLIAAQHLNWTAAVTDEARKAATLAAAQERQKLALQDVDDVWLKTVKALAARQLRAVEELETAARVVSQGVQGAQRKGSNP